MKDMPIQHYVDIFYISKKIREMVGAKLYFDMFFFIIYVQL